MIQRIGLLHWAATHNAKQRGGHLALKGLETDEHNVPCPFPLTANEWHAQLRQASSAIVSRGLMARVEMAHKAAHDLFAPEASAP